MATFNGANKLGAFDCLALLAIGFGACTESVTATEDDESAAASLDFSSFDAALDTAIARWNDSEAGASASIRGASVVVVSKKDGVLHTQGYGEFAADRLYLVASASKILSVGVLMRLQDENKLDIQQPINTYLRDWGEHKTNVTIAQLVSNSSGLPGLDEFVQKIGSPEGQVHRTIALSARLSKSSRRARPSQARRLVGGIRARICGAPDEC